MDDEPRLRTEDSVLGEALRDAQNVGPSETERAAMVAGLAGIFGPPPTGGLPAGPEAAASGASGGTSGSVAASALVKWAAAACLVGGAVWWGLPDDATPPDVMASVGAPAEPAPEVAPEVSPEVSPELAPEVAPNTGRVLPVTAALVLPLNAEASSEPTAPVVHEAATTARARPASRTQAPEEAATARSAVQSPEEPPSATGEDPQSIEEPAPERPSELALLAEARRVLRSSPAQTLRLAAEHREHFDSGAFVEEREVLAIEALVRLGRRGQAASRAERFDRRYPRSIHAGRIAAVLAP